jgi:hypothetical protein
LPAATASLIAEQQNIAPGERMTAFEIRFLVLNGLDGR